MMNIFLARLINKIIYKTNNNYEPLPFIWFIPFSSVSYFFIYLYYNESTSKIGKWFTGKDW